MSIASLQRAISARRHLALLCGLNTRSTRRAAATSRAEDQ
jgi:hypothetical protein